MQSTTISIRQLKKDASAEDVESATIVLAEAFQDDKLTYLITGGIRELLVPELRAVIKAGLIGGSVYVAETTESSIVGVTVWFGPGEELLGSDGQAEAGFNQFMEDLGKAYPEMSTWWMEYFLPVYAQFTTDSLGEGYKLLSWHLQYIGVLPRLQRQGIGSSLIKFVEDKVSKNIDSSNRHFCLETEAEGPLSFYNAIGYVIKGKMILEGEKKLSDSVPMWCLSKEL